MKGKKRQTFYFTFGFGQLHENGFYVVKGKNFAEARKEMIDKFGLKWAFQYPKERWFNEDGISQQEEYNLKEIK